MPDTTIDKKQDFLLLGVIFLSILSFSRIFFVNNIFWDDNCWFLSIFSSNNLDQFLNTGFVELQRTTNGTLLYYFFNLHKTSNYFNLIGHLLNMLTQIASPVMLYLLIKNLFLENNLLAFLISGYFIIFPMDATLPIYYTMGYRISIMLSLFSFYLTERVLAKNLRWFFLGLAFIISGISGYFFMEGVIALEFARLFIIWFILRNNGLEGSRLLKKSLLIWAPFVFLFLPLSIYKLLHKPYGFYAGTYITDFNFFLNWLLHKQLFAHLLFYQWFCFLRRNIFDATIWSLILTFSGGALLTYLFKQDRLISKWETFLLPNEGLKGITLSHRFILLLGLLFFIPPLLMYEFTGKVPFVGVDSRHGIVLQVGNAIIFGCLLYIFYQFFLSSRYRLRLFKVFLVVLFSLGVFFNNFFLDLYLKGSKQRTQFWNAFTTRFPSIPDNAVFIIDIDCDDYFSRLSLVGRYYLELPLNLLYAKSDNPNEFRRFKVFAPYEIKEKVFFKRHVQHGYDVFDSNRVIGVYYNCSDGKLFVNREILKARPGISYKDLINKDFPKLPKSISYPLRHKMWGFL